MESKLSVRFRAAYLWYFKTLNWIQMISLHIFYFMLISSFNIKNSINFQTNSIEKNRI